MLNKSIKIPKQLKINIKDNILFIENLNNNSKNSFNFNKNLIDIEINIEENLLYLKTNSNKNKKYLGLYYSIIKKKFRGLLQKFKVNLILKGIGYKILKTNNELIFKLGFSHDIFIKIPCNIEIILNNNNNIIFISNDYINLKKFVYKIKYLKTPEPYKGKGFLFKNEKILKKEGKNNKK